MHPRAQHMWRGEPQGSAAIRANGENTRAIKCRPKSYLTCLGKPGQPSGAVFLFPLAHFSPFHKAEFRWISAAKMKADHKTLLPIRHLIFCSVKKTHRVHLKKIKQMREK